MKATPEEDPERYRLGSPVDLVSDDAPPFLVVHGAYDTLAPPRDAVEFAERLRAVSREPVVRMELPGAQHAFDVFPSVRTATVLRGVSRFLAHTYARARPEVAVEVRDAV